MFERVLSKLQKHPKLSVPVCEDSTLFQTGDYVVVDYTSDYGNIPLDKYTYKLDSDKRNSVESYLTIVSVENAGVLLARYNLLKYFEMVAPRSTHPLAIRNKNKIVGVALSYNNLENSMQLINIGNPNSAFPIEPAFFARPYLTKVEYFLMYLKENPEVMKVEDIDTLQKELYTRWIVKECFLGMEHDHINMLYNNISGKTYLAEDYINRDSTVYFTEKTSDYLGYNLRLIEKASPGLLGEIANKIKPLLSAREEGSELKSAHYLLLHGVEEFTPYIGEFGTKRTGDFITNIVDRLQEFVDTYEKIKFEELNLQ